VFDELVWEEEPTIEMEELRAKLIQILNKLPEGYRLVFNLFAIENLSHKEIAEYLGISENTSKTQYFKAKKFIQKILESEKIAG
jgi:RNA polymerase sigma-70 factor (ECF subfamily)